MTTYSFTPPLDPNPVSNVDIDPVALTKNALGNHLTRHFNYPSRAYNVWVLLDGTCTTQQPNLASEYKKVYYGARGPYIVTAAEKAALEAAGFTVDTL